MQCDAFLYVRTKKNGNRVVSKIIIQKKSLVDLERRLNELQSLANEKGWSNIQNRSEPPRTFGTFFLEYLFKSHLIQLIFF